jgi:hypothetical protein
MPKVHQASIGIERQVTPNLSAQASYQMLRGRDQMRSINVNAPVNVGFDLDATRSGSDPTRRSATSRRFDSTGRSQSDRLEAPRHLPVPAGATFHERELRARPGEESRGQRDDPSRAAILDPDADWGPSRQDIRHRIQGQVNVPIVYGVRTSINVQAQSAPPYTITVRTDPNRDGVLNDRPIGVGRNTERGASTWTMGVNLTKQVCDRLAQRQGGGGGGFPRRRWPSRRSWWVPRRVVGLPDPALAAARAAAVISRCSLRSAAADRAVADAAIAAAAMRNSPRAPSLELFIRADNVLNRVNYGGFSGTFGSPFFGQPTSAQQPRRLTDRVIVPSTSPLQLPIPNESSHWKLVVGSLGVVGSWDLGSWS